MSFGYRLTATALRDLVRIGTYLRQHASEAVATRFEGRLLAACEDLAHLEALGHRRSTCRKPVLFYNVPPYVLAFRREPEVIVVRVLHGARDISRLI